MRKRNTHQLYPGHVLLPPDVLAVFGSEGGDEVVRVHDDVYEGVEETDYYALGTGQVLQVAPGEQRGYGVVIDVEERHLVVFLTEDEEYLQF